ncbi:hypothetical protein HWC16_gp063 [Salmonella phage Sepoy]|uniref:Uncharacterized protein n=1 Tax=Salmonella phage Sepoy TaxID=2565517 RepID=A0A4P8NLY3_9CAUD|nr:hypothetical protein HWC16_gp063 [Salmonella phage Sepoy]QCQ65557.1 hypothetical protein Sepoy_063 [Salmonella phage Sepoy]
MSLLRRESTFYKWPGVTAGSRLQSCNRPGRSQL